MTEAEELEYLRLKKRKAVAMQATAPARPEVNEATQPAQNAQPSPYTPDMIDSMYGKQNSGLMNQAGAFADRFVNSATFGNAANINAGLSKLGIGAPDMGSDFAETKANENVQRKSLSDAAPVAGMAGDLTGFIAPGTAAYKLGSKVVSPIVRALGSAAPKGAGAGSRAIRYGGRLAASAAEGAAQFGLYQGTVGASNKEMETGESVGAGESLQMAKEGATDPLAWAAGPALSGVFRLGKYAKSGGQTFTPDAVAARVNAALTPGRSQILDAEQFGVIEPQAEKLLFRLLGDAGYSRNDITSAINTFEQSVQGSENLAMLPSRLKDALVVKLGDGAEEVVDGFLQGAANRTGTQGASAVSSGVAEDAGRISQFVNDSADSRFGSGSRFQTLEGAEQELSTIGNQYETLFKPGAVVASPADEQALKEVVDFYANDRELSKYVSAQASKLRMTPQQYIAENPRRAAHLMQQVAREIVDENPSPTLVNAYSGIRDNLLKPLEASTPGYNQVRKEFGDEYGFKKALSFAGRFFTKAEDEVAVGQLAKEYAAMTPRQQDAAKLAMRDESLKFANRRSEGGSPRLSKIGNEPSLAAMERVFGQEGAEFANDIRTASDRLRRNQRISPGTGSNTMNKQQASEFAESAVSNKLVRGIGNALQNMGGDAAISGATGVFSPVMTGRAMIRGAGNALAKGRQGKIDKLSGLLMKDAGSRPRAPMSGDGPVPTPTAAPVNALSQGADPVAAPARSFTRNDSGMVTPDAASALSIAGGAGTGASMAGDVDGDGKVTWKDRAAGAAAGAAVGYGLKKGIGGASDALFTNQVMAREGGRASRMASEAIANIPKPSRPGQPMTGAEADDLLTARLNEVLAKNRIDPRDFYAGTAKIDQKKFAPMQEAERLVLEDMKALGYGPPADAEWLRAIRTFSPEQYNKWQATGARDMVSKFRQVQGKEMTPEIPPFEGPRVIDSPGRSMVKPRPSNDTKSSGVAALRGDATNALAGGAVGAAAPADNNRDRARNALIGAGGGAVGARAFPGVRTYHHGSPVKGLTKIKASDGGWSGPGVYLSKNSGTAAEYTGKGGEIYKATISGKLAKESKLPLMKTGSAKELAERNARLADQGYVGIVADKSGAMPGTVVVFDPKNVRIIEGGTRPAGISGKPRLGKSLHDIMSDNPPPRDPKTGQFVKQEPKKPKSPILPLTAAGAATLGGVGYYATHSGKPRKDPADDRKLMNRALATQRK